MRIVPCFATVVAYLLFANSTCVSAESHEAPGILLTADGEGHVGPCSACPLHVGLGGLARRATLIARQRQSGPLLLLDAGNSFFGGESAVSKGKVIAAAYDALGYDAVNISYRDFRHGREATLALLQGRKFSGVSANLLDEETGRLLFKPYVLERLGDQNLAILGLTESPAGLQSLPLLREQLAGVRIRSPLDALAEWLPKAKADSDHVILLYYGTPAGLEPIRHRFGNELAMILLGGLGPDDLPPASDPPQAAAEKHGKTIARIRWGASAAEHLLVDSSVAPDPAMLRLLAANSALSAPP